MKSKLALAKIKHQRLTPINHVFVYSMAYLWINFDEIQALTGQSRLWSFNKFNLVSIHTKDFFSASGNLTDTKAALIQAINDKLSCQVAVQGYEFYALMLPRYVNYGFNPVSFYYLFDKNTQRLTFIVSEITNTPWGEKYSYIHKCGTALKGWQNDVFEFPKAFHVSPFMPMNLMYRWRFSTIAQDKYAISMTLKSKHETVFNASMKIELKVLNKRDLYLYPFIYPLQSVMVMLRIYVHALVLKIKKVPFFKHPKKSDTLKK